jgi:hypothetical protein
MKLKEACRSFVDQIEVSLDAGFRPSSTQINKTEDDTLLILALDAYGSPVAYVNLESHMELENLEDGFMGLLISVQTVRDFRKKEFPSPPAGA